MSMPAGDPSTSTALIPPERIAHSILFIRGHKVMLDADLAVLYGVDTKSLNQSVKRNIDRFPADFMFQLTTDEAEALRCQVGTSNGEPVGALRSLSTVLRSPRAVRVNVETMRTFVRLRQALASHADLARKLDQLEAKYDRQFKVVFDAIRRFVAAPQPSDRKIGFRSK
jgi:hypothetical protein